MAYYKKKSFNSHFDFMLGKGEKRVESKFAEMKNNPEKLWYGIIEAEGKHYVGEFYSKLRIEATRFFEEQALKLGGQVTYVKAT